MSITFDSEGSSAKGFNAELSTGYKDQLDNY